MTINLFKTKCYGRKIICTDIDRCAVVVVGHPQEQLNACVARLKSAALKAAVSTNTRIIKADIPQAMWKEFGIQSQQ